MRSHTSCTIACAVSLTLIAAESLENGSNFVWVTRVLRRSFSRGARSLYDWRAAAAVIVDAKEAKAGSVLEDSTITLIYR